MMISGPLGKCRKGVVGVGVVVGVDMAHTMLIFLQQQDMQHLVLLPYTTIQAQFMGVCISVSAFVHVMLAWVNIVMGEYCYDDLLCRGAGREFRGMGKKIFVGRLPQEASADDLRQYFGRFGRILDVYVPKVKTKFS